MIRFLSGTIRGYYITDPNRTVSPTPDYQSLSTEAFRALENRIKSAAHDGKRITL